MSKPTRSVTEKALKNITAEDSEYMSDTATGGSMVTLNKIKSIPSTRAVTVACIFVA